MSRRSWVVDPSRFATKIKSASSDPEDVNWKSDPTIVCPKCQHPIDNSEVGQQWPGLPKGVKFDPADPEIIEHLLAKVGRMDSEPHPFIDEFIITVDREDGICYTHPQNLPGVKKDGTASHFFHRAVKAYGTGTRKRRKIQGEDFGDLRWHKTGRTRPVILDGVQKGCKKIMVLYMSFAGGGKAEKTNWVIHQYHLGVDEDEKDGQYVISKIFYQQQAVKPGDKIEQDFANGTTSTDAMTVKVDPVTPKSVTPEPPRVEKLSPSFDNGQDDFGPHQFCSKLPVLDDSTEVHQPKYGHPSNEISGPSYTEEMAEDDENHIEEGTKWWEGDSQNMLDSQQMVEALSLCDDFLHSQSPDRAENVDGASKTNPKPSLSDYAHLGKEHLKRDLEECQNFVLDPANIETDTPPDFRLSQLEFGSQDSFISWGGAKAFD